jgi:hypothetical protein
MPVGEEIHDPPVMTTPHTLFTSYLLPLPSLPQSPRFPRTILAQ